MYTFTIVDSQYQNLGKTESPFFMTNSASQCDRTTSSCKCATTEQCTEETSCNIGGFCKGRYSKSQ